MPASVLADVVCGDTHGDLVWHEAVHRLFVLQRAVETNSAGGDASTSATIRTRDQTPSGRVATSLPPLPESTPPPESKTSGVNASTRWSSR